MVRRRLPLEHTDIEINEIESSRRTTATSFPVACECKMVITPEHGHTTINRRWSYPLVGLEAIGKERREISGVGKGSRRLPMAAPPQQVTVGVPNSQLFTAAHRSRRAPGRSWCSRWRR